MKIRIRLPTYYSDQDEDRFFLGLKTNPGIKDFRGVGRDLVVTLRMSKMSQDAARDLLALLWRYGVVLEPLADLVRYKKFSWLLDPAGYWQESMFPRRRISTRRKKGP